MFKIRRSNLAFDKLNSSDRYFKAKEKLTKNIPSVDHQLHLKYIRHIYNLWIKKDKKAKFLNLTRYTYVLKCYIALLHAITLQIIIIIYLIHLVCPTYMFWPCLNIFVCLYLYSLDSHEQLPSEPTQPKLILQREVSPPQAANTDLTSHSGLASSCRIQEQPNF